MSGKEQQENIIEVISLLNTLKTYSRRKERLEKLGKDTSKEDLIIEKIKGKLNLN